jgi:hypothetical protein
MKRNSHSQNFDLARYESFDLSDTRYYGVFLKGQGKEKYILIDPKRYENFFTLTEEMKIVINKRIGPLFSPTKRKHLDYDINFMSNGLSEIRQRWECTYKPIINHVLSEIKDKVFTPGDDDLYQSGILEPEEAAINANMKTLISRRNAETERTFIYYTLYSGFFHQMVSQIEALFVRVLARNGRIYEKFSRNDVYHFKGTEHEKTANLVCCLEGFSIYDQMYLIWHFIKHNNLSTYKQLKDKYPHILLEDEYTSGEPACFFVKFDDSLIDVILSGVERFAKEYCHLAFGENEQEARWNSDEYFLSKVRDVIEAGENPLGLPWYI